MIFLIGMKNNRKGNIIMEKNIVYFDKDVVVINDVKQQMLENYSLADYLLLLFVMVVAVNLLCDFPEQIL